MKTIIHKAKKILKALLYLSSLVGFFRNIFSLPKAIVRVYEFLVGILVALGLYLKIFPDKIYNIFQLKILELQIVLKAWTIPILLLILVTFILAIISSIRKRKQKAILSQSPKINLEPYKGYKWRWGKDPIGRIIIDDMPYCTNHEQRFESKHYHDYQCPEPNCGEGIVFVHYRDIIKDVIKHITAKYQTN